MLAGPCATLRFVRTVLLIADLEGITGVDSLEALVGGGEGADAAVHRMNEEVAFVARLLLEAGVEHVRISDAHRSGAPNLDPSLLPARTSVHLEDDLYGGALLDGVEAVACVGMHASAQAAGFGAHCVSLSTAWTHGGAPLSETALVRLLAAERGVPLWFSSGDDVLARELGEVPVVITKRSRAVDLTASRPWRDVEQDFRAVVRAAPSAVPDVPRAPLEVRFQTLAEAEAAATRTGRTRQGTRVILETASSFGAQYTEALRLIDAAQDALLARVSGQPGTREFARSAAALFAARWE